MSNRYIRAMRMYASIKASLPAHIAETNRIEAQQRLECYTRWGEGFDLLRLMISGSHQLTDRSIRLRTY